MFSEFFTSNNIRVQVLEVSVLLHKSAFIQAYLFLPNSLTLFKHQMTPDEYAQWGADDDFIKHFICSNMPILGVPIDADGGQMIQTAATATQQMLDDNRSVHNEQDIAKINTLETQMIEQQRLLAQMRAIMISKGLI